MLGRDGKFEQCSIKETKKKADEYRYVEMKGKDRQTEVLQKTTRTKKCDRNVILSS